MFQNRYLCSAVDTPFVQENVKEEVWYAMEVIYKVCTKIILVVIQSFATRRLAKTENIGRLMRLSDHSKSLVHRPCESYVSVAPPRIRNGLAHAWLMQSYLR